MFASSSAPAKSPIANLSLRSPMRSFASRGPEMPDIVEIPEIPEVPVVPEVPEVPEVSEVPTTAVCLLE